MDYKALCSALGLDQVEIRAVLKKAVRIGDVYKSGRVEGLKPGLFGVGERNGKHEVINNGKLKPRRVLIVYNIATYGRSEHSDWVDVDNCDFEIVPQNGDKSQP